ncbi:MAG: lysylphosphatidylglycerol synthase transmembrane domain-containing protein [Polaribacter sp.]|nr:flippase-like domain-containing protein [Polaribacter sp.]MDA9336959.1 flippase-like domain-containing protein [Polaribacter sp.]MDB9771069.1 flippase-like domain-containing protein [Polaribacter sp.]MDB9922554.1 flippase-like domain-containing protein [Polaribacter sp.]MDG1222318.1 lysylphosphatidylglycerol synthase transmembrane domain-containing protein [Polaribacter sp.]
MNSTRKKILKTTLPLLLGGVLVWYSLAGMDQEKMITHLRTANYGWIFLGLFFGVLSHLSRAYRWKFMLAPMGYKPKFTNSVLAVLIGYFVNLAIPRAGEVSRATVMVNYENIPFQKGFGTIVAERIADMIMMFLIIGITLFFQFDYILALVSENFDPIKIGFLLLGIIGATIVFTSFVKKAKQGFLLKIKNFILSLVEGVTSILKMEKKWNFIFHTFFIWTMYVAMFWATIPAIQGLEVPVGGILVGFIAGGFSIAATNGGIGSYPLAVTGAFLLFNVPESPSEAFGWIMWSAQTLMIIVFGGLAFLVLPIYNKKK